MRNFVYTKSATIGMCEDSFKVGGQSPGQNTKKAAKFKKQTNRRIEHATMTFTSVILAL